MQSHKPTRRDFLTGALAGGLATILPGRMTRAVEPRKPATRAQPFRFVHLADIHVQPERDAARGFAKALDAVEALRPRPDFILTGGDLVMDVFEKRSQRARELFRLYKQILADHTSLPVYDTLGNHDVFGWRTKTGVTPDTPGYGKQLAQEYLGLKQTYYHFDHKGWRFFVLDNIQPDDGPRGYLGSLDSPQRAWLEQELKRTPPNVPIVFCEHIPLMSVTPFAYEELYHNGHWILGGSLICADAPDRLDLIRRHNVKLCLSGHTHQCDDVRYHGVRFVNDGAVSGRWWRGDNRGVEEGFGVFDLRPDGVTEYDYHDYGWQPPPEEP
jgi:Icc protein